jgi:hypothetical protein
MPYEFPESMEEFCQQFQEDPIWVYLMMAKLAKDYANSDQYQEEDLLIVDLPASRSIEIPKPLNFPFPPYQSLIRNLIKNLETEQRQKLYAKWSAAETRNRESDMSQFEIWDDELKNILKELKKLLKRGCPYGDSTRVIEKMMNLMSPGGDSRYEKSPIDPWTTRALERSGGYAFAFACDAPLELPFFLATRSVPLFSIGCALNPQDYDDTKHATTIGFWLHDIGHMSRMYLSDTKSQRYQRYSTTQSNHEYEVYLKPNYNMIDRHRMWIYLRTIIEKINDPNFKYAVELILFEHYHEREGAEFIDENGEMILKKNHKQILDQIHNRIDGDFKYPEQYKNKAVRELCEAALEFVINATRAYSEPPMSLETKKRFCDPEVNEMGKLVEELRDLEEKSKIHAAAFVSENPRVTDANVTIAVKSDLKAESISIEKIGSSEIEMRCGDKCVKIGKNSDLLSSLIERSRKDSELMKMILKSGDKNSLLVHEAMCSYKKDQGCWQSMKTLAADDPEIAANLMRSSVLAVPEECFLNLIQSAKDYLDEPGSLFSFRFKSHYSQKLAQDISRISPTSSGKNPVLSVENKLSLYFLIREYKDKGLSVNLFGKERNLWKAISDNYERISEKLEKTCDLTLLESFVRANPRGSQRDTPQKTY